MLLNLEPVGRDGLSVGSLVDLFEQKKETRLLSFLKRWGVLVQNQTFAPGFCETCLFALQVNEMVLQPS